MIRTVSVYNLLPLTVFLKAFKSISDIDTCSKDSCFVLMGGSDNNTQTVYI